MSNTPLRFAIALGVGFCAPLLPAFSSYAQAQAIGSIISYQGQLSGANGAPIADGTTSLTFKIYEAGTEKSSQTMSVATIGGVFNTFLSVGALTFDPTKAYELGVTFNGSETRHAIAAVPVALTAATAGSISGVVPIANGGTGSATQPFVDLTTAQTVAGAKTFASAVSAPGFNIGTDRVLGTSPNKESVFVGRLAGAASGTANSNVLVGTRAGTVSTGISNVFLGSDAGRENTTGRNNTALGDLAGSSLTTGNNNIAIANNGVAGESSTIRIGSSSQNRAFIAGIRGATGLSNTFPVVVDASGQLGTGAALSSQFVDLTTAQTVAGAKTFSDALTGGNTLLLNGTTGATPASGAGTRLMWVPAKGAFRAGTVDGTQWDAANIGQNSMSLGNDTTASGPNSTAMGANTTASGSVSTALGSSTTASGQYSTALGYRTTASGAASTALGFSASTNGKNGSFVYGDTSNSATLNAEADYQAVWRTAGGFKIFTSPGLTTGVNLAAGSGSWSNLSDRNAKDKFGAIDSREVLKKVSALPLSSWQYKGNPSRHIGPMAQDFRAAFGLGPDEKHIDTVDADGVALAAIQGLNSELRDRDAKIALLQAQNAAFEARLKKLEGVSKAR